MNLAKHYLRWLPLAALAALAAFCGKHLLDGHPSQVYLFTFLGSSGTLILTVAVLLLRSKWAKLSSMVTGALLLLAAVHLLGQTSEQVRLYNEAMDAYGSRDAVKAIKALDASLAAYKQQTQLNPLSRLIYGEPRRDLAALSLFHKANILIQAQKAELAIEAYKESLRVNPGDEYLGMSPSQAETLNKIALDVKYNLEMLFKSGQGQGQGQGKGKDKGDGKGQPSNQREPDDDPGTQRGNGSRDDI